MPYFYDGAFMEHWPSLDALRVRPRALLIPRLLFSTPILTANFLGAFQLGCGSLLAAEATDQPTTHPPARTDSLSSFRVQPGFRLELVAAEPQVAAPVAIAFDEHGRLFVAEMLDYLDPHKDPHLGRVRVLTGLDAEGVYQTSSVYAEDLVLPSALACYAGGVFVAAMPDVFYFKDSKGDGVADLRKVVLTGFGGTNTPNLRALVNNFNWGLDNRIHGAAADVGGLITASNWPSTPVSLAGFDFSFDPRSLAVFPETGPSQSGLTFDQNGRRFTCDYSCPLRLPMYAPRYAVRNPFYVEPPEMIDVASPDSSILHWKSSGTAAAGSNSRGAASNTNAPVATNLLTATWLTNAQGCLIYRGGAFPTNYLGNAFVADPSAHAVHRMVLRENGLEPVAERAPEDRQSEFLVSRDPSFHPMQVVGGPDGAIYIVDRQEEPERGRIYRVVPINFLRPKPPQMGKARTYDLVAALAGNDGWHLDTAARLLYERHDPNSIGLLTNMLNNSRVSSARLRSLYALEGQGMLEGAHVARALQDSDPRVREHAILLSELVATNGDVSDEIWNLLRARSTDPSLHVRYQLAFSAGEFARPDKVRVLAEVLRRDPANRGIQNAVWSSAAEGAGNLFLILANDPRVLNDPAGNAFLHQLATMIGTKGRMDEIQQVTSFAAQPQLDRFQVFGMLADLGQGLRMTRSSLVMANPQGRLERFFSTAMEAAIDSFSPPATRVQAVRLTGVSSYSFADTSDWLLMLCNPQPWLELRATAMATVAHYDDLGAVTGLLNRWSTFPPVLRRQAVASLLGRRSHVLAIVQAIERGILPAGDLSSTQRDFLRTYSDPAVSERALRLFGQRSTARSGVMDLFRPALRLTGIAEQGQTTFLARCSGCHQLGVVGQPFGPSLIAARPKGKESILISILEPNAYVPARYQTCVVQTQDGDNLVGIQSGENLGNLTLHQPGGTGLVCPRLNVRNIYIQPWSLMPEDLEQGLSPQDMADLLEYIMTARK